MEAKNGNVPILLEAEYYQNFHCLAENCKNVCCQGWRIHIDRAHYNKLRAAKMSPELSALVETGFHRNHKEVRPERYAQMDLNEKGYCVFLNEKNLCGLQAECGASFLPEVCLQFPRQINLVGNYVERLCTAGCEEVVNLLWDLPEGLNFICSPLEKQIKGGIVTQNPEYPVVNSRFFEIQTVCMGLLQNRSYPLRKRLMLLGVAMKALAAIERTQDVAEVDRWVDRYTALSFGDGFHEELEKLQPDLLRFIADNGANVQKFLNANISSKTRDWLEQICRNLKMVAGDGENSSRITVDLTLYQACQARLDAVPDIDILLENLVVNHWFDSGLLSFDKGVWRKYVCFCAMYSLLRFLLTGTMTEEAGRAEIVNTVTFWGRLIVHNREWLDYLTNNLIQNESSSLAHMAVLIGG